MPNSLYLMPPSMFENLKSVSGFTNLNGKTYTEHICIIFKEKLTEQQKKSIMSKKNSKEALDYLNTIISYTHLHI